MATSLEPFSSEAARLAGRDSPRVLEHQPGVPQRGSLLGWCQTRLGGLHGGIVPEQECPNRSLGELAVNR